MSPNDAIQANPSLGHGPAFAPAAILGAALAGAIGPAVLHLTSSGSNPFLYNTFIMVTQVVVFTIVLVSTRHRLMGDSRSLSPRSGQPMTEPRNLWRLTSVRLHLAHFRRIESPDGTAQSAATIDSVELNKPKNWLRLPLLWAAIGSLHYGVLAWSTAYIETALASTLYELWPIVLVYLLARHNKTDILLRQPQAIGTPRVVSVPWEKLILSSLAALGVVFMLGGQATRNLNSTLDIISYGALVGIVLALASAILQAVNVLGTLVYGKVLFYRLVGTTDGDAQQRHENQRLVLWLTFLGIVIVRIVNIPISLGFSLVAFDVQLNVSFAGVLGSVTLGIAFGASAILIRVGNVLSQSPSINVLFFVSPVVALALLMVIGISLPRFDLFIIGAALIVATNILIQLKPDEERDFSQFGKDPKAGTRLGFTAFIISIWVFGTVIYTRDEVLAVSWLQWSAGDYWTMIGLSATVFALILGFRVARLSSRIGREDEIMLTLFRDVEYLERKLVLDNRTSEKLSDLDTVQSKHLLGAYNSVRDSLLDGIPRAGDRDDQMLLLSVEKNLDELAHSKQQGRDIVELMSLTAFAMVTVGLGLLARPRELDGYGESWSGFLTEVFVLIFVSTVAFLCVNLFDVRRDRDTPLLVQVREMDDDFRVFFRYKRDLTMQHFSAILICIAIIGTFGVLLYGKWL